MAEETFNADATDEIKGTTNQSDGETLPAREAQDVSVSTQAHVHLDVGSVVGGGTITAATLYYYSISYAVTGAKPATKDHMSICIHTDSDWYEFFDEADYGLYVGDGLASVALDATALGHIMENSDEVGYDTEFRWSVDNPGAGRSRLWTIAAYENSTYTEAYLVVTYTEASAGTPRTFVIGV